MSRIILAVVAVALAAPALFAAPVRPEGEKETVFPYPAKAPVVVCLNGYDKVRDRLYKLITAALPTEAEKLTAALDELIKQALEGRKLTAVRRDARIFIVLNDLDALIEGMPAVSVLVPVTSHKEFLDTFLTERERQTLDRGRDGVDVLKSAAIGEELPFFLVDLKEYTAITIDKATADGYTAKFTAGTSEAMGSELAATFLKADLAVFLNMDQINDQHGEQIRGIQALADFSIQQVAQEGMLPGLGEKQLGTVKTLIKGVFQGIEDCEAVVLGVELRPEGIAARLQVRFAENSPSAKFVAAEASGQATDLGKLPAGLEIYNQTHFGKSISELIRQLSQEFVTTPDDARGAMLIEELLKDRVAAGPQGEWSATAPPGVGITIAAYDDPVKAQRAITKAFKAVAAGGRVNSVVVKTAPRVLDEAVTHRGFVFSSVHLNHDFEATVATLPNQVRQATLDTLKRTVNEKADLWIGTDEKVVVTLAAKDWETAKAMLDRYLDGKGLVGGRKGFKLTRSQLPDDASFLTIGETTAALTSLLDVTRGAGEALPGVLRLGPVKPLKGEPTYVGLAVSLKGEVISVTAFVPVESIVVGRKILEDLLKVIN